MNYLISPWVFYVMSVFESLGFIFGLLWIVFVATFIVFFLILIGSFFTEAIDVDDISSFFKKTKGKKKYVIIPIILFAVLSIAVPSKETMIQMLVASQVHQENYEFAKDELTDLVDYIVDKIDGNKEE